MRSKWFNQGAVGGYLSVLIVVLQAVQQATDPASLIVALVGIVSTIVTTSDSIDDLSKK